MAVPAAAVALATVESELAAVRLSKKPGAFRAVTSFCSTLSSVLMLPRALFCCWRILCCVCS
jgi:hypothetical protein